MTDPEEVERLFRRLHQELVHQYEETAKRMQRLAEKSEEQQRRQLETLRPLLSTTQTHTPDPKILTKLELASTKSLREFLAEVRPQLTERTLQRARDAKHLAFYSALQIPGACVAPIYAATLLSADSKDLDGNPGERGNPWIVADNPSLVRIKKSSTGNFNACAALPAVPAPKAAFWFTFFPPKEGTWTFVAFLYLRGWYIIHTDFLPTLAPVWWNPFQISAFCVESRAKVHADLDVYRGAWVGAHKYDLLDYQTKTDNISQSLDLDGLYTNSVWLPASSLVLVKLEITIDAVARGSGYYSEVNFSDSQNAYIQPLGLVATTS